MQIKMQKKAKKKWRFFWPLFIGSQSPFFIKSRFRVKKWIFFPCALWQCRYHIQRYIPYPIFIRAPIGRMLLRTTKIRFNTHFWGLLTCISIHVFDQIRCKGTALGMPGVGSHSYNRQKIANFTTKIPKKSLNNFILCGYPPQAWCG